MYYIIAISAFVSSVYAAYMALIVAPPDAMQGNVQRIFYFHVPLVWVSFLAFLGGAITSVIYLRTRDFKYDVWARTYIKTGWAFTTTVLVTGPLWAKPVWGAYWNWADERLVSFFVMWMMYNAYLLLRSTIHDQEKAARIGAVLALIAIVNAALVVAAIYIWKTASHPGPLFTGKAGTGLQNPEMKLAFSSSFAAYTLLFICILVARHKREEAMTP